MRDQWELLRVSICAGTHLQSLAPLDIAARPPGRPTAHTWRCIDPYAPPPFPACSAGSADRAAWRNPLSWHFSFPLTDGPWRARAFGPPVWLAARQLNKLSSCYNSLKHFQLPQSNKSCRQAFGRLPTRSPGPAGAFPLVCLALRHATASRSSSSGPKRRARRSEKWKGAIPTIWGFSPSFCCLPLLR